MKNIVRPFKRIGDLKYYLILGISLFVACSVNHESGDEEGEKDPVITVPEGFILDELFRPTADSLGTWVALAEGPGQRMYASDQFGDLYTFPIPAIGDSLQLEDIDSIDLDIGHAHGLLWAFNSLYVAVNLKWEDTIETASGIYRLTDTNDDEVLDHKEMLLRLEGFGEHGPHSFIVGPGGDDIYFIAGNHTDVPDILMENSRLPIQWDEDNLLPVFPDARGHAVDRMAPGGWIARFKPDGSDWELIAAGFRNAFDIAFNDEGELFAFDADMEWDFGMPWYRPIRICHVTSGAEFGWRRGTGKWPVYYPDALPAVIDLGQGSPTGLLYGAELNFPAKYRSGMFALDWSFGTMYYIDLKEEGSTYTGSKEQFLYGVPFPLTDAIAGSDGHMYFAIGGRKLASRLYRLRYSGSDSTSTPVSLTDDKGNQVRALRQDLEQIHRKDVPGATGKAWNALDHDDRFVRYAARVALEHQPVSEWKSRVWASNEPAKVVPGVIALIRQDSTTAKRSVAKLNTIAWEGLSRQHKLDLLRAYELILSREDRADTSGFAVIVQRFGEKFPTGDNEIDRELAEILIYLDDESATSTCMDLLQKHTEENTLMEVAMLTDEISSRHDRYGKDVKEVVGNMPPAEAIFYAVVLCHADVGWNEEMRTDYFQWFYDVYAASGGKSFKAFMENIKQKALKHVPEDKREHFQTLSGVYSPAGDLADLPQPHGPGYNYGMDSINKILRVLRNYEGDFEDGERAYQAAMCITCHRMKGEGGISGPDLTQLHTRFDRGDMLTAIYIPSDEISDQYAFTLFEMNDGSKTAGKVYNEEDDLITLMPNPYTSTYKIDIKKSDIEERGLSPISPMPPGLLNRLGPQEIIDLFAYLLSGGDKEHFYFGGENGREER